MVGGASLSNREGRRREPETDYCRGGTEKQLDWKVEEEEVEEEEEEEEEDEDEEEEEERQLLVSELCGQSGSGGEERTGKRLFGAERRKKRKKRKNRKKRKRRM
ncbi:unnamed protein product [Pleuronectes platessa]|uniref:Uncharacterized protein n=1 Tax=Pleuronectes platessa TaxID=8262 RepID=A0A9N7ZDE1_PLEPL|nr:unnamed protein product [Pleuronectes platessa]